MGFFDRFKKKKKVEDTLVDETKSFSQPEFNQLSRFQEFRETDRDTQLLISKLDLINLRLQSIEQRLAVLEKIAKESQEPEKW